MWNVGAMKGAAEKDFSIEGSRKWSAIERQSKNLPKFFPQKAR